MTISPAPRLIALGRALVPVLVLVLLSPGVSVAEDATPTILITEVMAANTRTVADDQGGYSDWIELHNPTDMPIALAGYTITDDPDEPAKWTLPVATLAPGAFLVIWASGLDQVTTESWHTNFRLSRGGEYVGLFGPDGQVVDEVTFGAQAADVSLGRLAGSDQWVAFSIPTPGAANTTRPRAVPGTPQVMISLDRELFTGLVTVHLAAPVAGSVVYYTLDGSDPMVGGHEYMAPLAVEETTVLRAVALRDGVPVSADTTATYLFGESIGLPVLSLVTDPAHLWDEATGIYVNPEERGREWERPVTVEWLSPEGEVGFSVGAGLRIHGNTGRRLPKQSFRLYFRGAYGPRELAYPLFGPEPGQTYDRLVLRAGVDDSWECRGGARCVEEAVYVRDQLVRDLHGAMGQVAARGHWVTLYLNGAYWGLYNLTERIDETFLARRFDHDDWDTEEHQAWDALVDWITGTDLSQETQYEQVLQQFDIENFTSFVILHLWAGNTDWASNNWYAARMRDGPDTRWRLFVWDAETTLGLGQEIDASEDVSFSQAVIYGGLDASLILASLLASPQYQAYFAAQVERHLAGALDTGTVHDRLAALVVELRPAIAAEAVRWRPDQEPDVAVAQWEAALQRIADSLAANVQRLRELSDPEMLRALLPQPSVSDDLPPVQPLPPGTRIALVVHNTAELTPGDAAVVAHLAARGVPVTVIGTDEGSQHDPAQLAADHDLLLVSSSVRRLDTAERYFQPTTPLIFWGPQLLEQTQVSRWGGTRQGGYWIRLVDLDHPITAGLPAGRPAGRPLRVVRQATTFSVSYRSIGQGVHVLARHLVGGDEAVMVAEAGAELLNGQTAKARTVFLYWHHDTFMQSTGEAVRLFDQAVDWALGRSR